MGKSNNFLFKNKSTNQEEINNILTVDEIKILNEINKKFIKKIIICFSNFIKNNIKLNSFSIKVNSYTDNDNDIRYLFFNEVEMLDVKQKFFVFFSDNLLAVFIDLLFGGKGFSVEKITKKRNITYTEKMITQKILEMIFKTYCEFFKEFISIKIKNFNIKIIDIKEASFLEKNFINHYFNFSINGINIFFCISLPILIIQKNFQHINSFKNNKHSVIKNKNIPKIFFLNNVYDIELDVITKLILSSSKNYNSLSIGDILIIKSPDKVISYIEKTPIFLGYYKNFNKKLVVFLKKVIHKNVDLNKYEDFKNE